MPLPQTSTTRPRILVSWSGGKDSAWALHLLRQSAEYEIVGLFTTINQSFRRIAIHGVREALLDAQAAALALPLWKIELPFPCTNQQYEDRMHAVIVRAQQQGIHAIAFGDLFLEDIRAYRERMLQGTGIAPLFPVWGIPTDTLATQMIDAGLRARLVTVDPRRLDASFVGRSFDAALLASLPPGTDPCGERGEFHTFVHAAPIFSRPIPITPGEIVERDGFLYADLLPSEPPEVCAEVPANPGPESPSESSQV